jgi:N-acetylglucosamine malate deacetylase 2
MITSWQELPPGPLLIICAHPDDEILAAALAAAQAAAGYPVKVVSLSPGEGGLRPNGISVPELGILRPGELQSACSALDAGKPEVLAFSDIGLEYADPDDAARALLPIYEEFQPLLVVRLPDDGITGHPGHILASRAARMAHKKAAPRGARLWEPVATPDWGELPLDRFMYNGAPLLIYPPSALVLNLLIPPWLRRKKVAAIRAHVSQAPSLDLLWPAVTQREAYREVV